MTTILLVSLTLIWPMWDLRYFDLVRPEPGVISVPPVVADGVQQFPFQEAAAPWKAMNYSFPLPS